MNCMHALSPPPDLTGHETAASSLLAPLLGTTRRVFQATVLSLKSQYAETLHFGHSGLRAWHT